MKKIFKLAALAAAMVAVLLSCSTDKTNPVSGNGRYTTEFRSAQCSTKVSFAEKEGSFYKGLWTDGESAKFVMSHAGGTAVADAAVTTYDATIANFVAEFDAVADSRDFIYFAVVPAANFVSMNAETGVRYSIRDEQSPSADNFDPEASVLIGMTEMYAVQQGVQDEAGTRHSGPLNLDFDYGVAYGRMNLKNLALAEGESVVEVLLTADEAALSGTADWKAGEITVIDGMSEIRMSATSVEDIWFVSLPATLEDGKWSVAVTTDKGVYTRKISETGKSLVLSKGVVTEFAVDMAAAEFNVSQKIPYSKYIDASECTLDGAALSLQGGWIKGMNGYRPSSITFTLDDVPAAGKYRLLLFLASWNNGYNHGFDLSINGGEDMQGWVTGGPSWVAETLELVISLKSGSNTLVFKASTSIPDNYENWGPEFRQFLVTNQDTPTELDGSVPNPDSGTDPAPEPDPNPDPEPDPEPIPGSDYNGEVPPAEEDEEITI